MSAILLLLTKSDVQTKLAGQIDRARTELLNQPIQSEGDYRQVSQALSRWQKYNIELLKSLFTTDGPAKEFDRPIHYLLGPAGPLPQMVQKLHRDIETYINRLQSILERVELYQEAPSVTTPSSSSPAYSARIAPKEPSGRAVFIVHGRAGREHEVARAVEALDLEAVILQERLHGGAATLIEKLEREAGPCGYAIVVYTGDDEGRIFGSGDDLKRRARENVVLELGYFVGLLGRSRVTVLHDPDVEVPSDFHGVGYYTLDPAGAWRDRIKGELQRIGLI